MDGTSGGPLALRADVVATVLDEGALLLDLESKYFYLLNPSAWALVQLYEAGGTTVDQARATCARAGAADGQVQEITSYLVAEGLVEPASIGPAPVESAGDGQPELSLSGPWVAPSIEKQDEPLQRVIVNAFDPTVPLAE